MDHESPFIPVENPRFNERERYVRWRFMARLLDTRLTWVYFRTDDIGDSGPDFLPGLQCHYGMVQNWRKRCLVATTLEDRTLLVAKLNI